MTRAFLLQSLAIAATLFSAWPADSVADPYAATRAEFRAAYTAAGAPPAAVSASQRVGASSGAQRISTPSSPV